MKIYRTVATMNLTGPCQKKHYPISLHLLLLLGFQKIPIYPPQGGSLEIPRALLGGWGGGGGGGGGEGWLRGMDIFLSFMFHVHVGCIGSISSLVGCIMKCV